MSKLKLTYFDFHGSRRPRQRYRGGKIVALWGARRPDQLAPIKDVMGWTLDDSAMREIDRILAETIKDDVGPEFMAPQPSRTSKPGGTLSAIGHLGPNHALGSSPKQGHERTLVL